uniref:C2H2-type domain-containing protein n=1 Tax=Periophthalmus magnuspinnatus TaxID=409849 RepID=A0A3B3ZME2_9GOBI
MFIETNIKVEEPDLWSISETQPQLRAPASGLKKDPPPPTTTQRHPHEQDHENLTPNHKTKSEDSDEECPICRQLDLHQKEELTEQGKRSFKNCWQILIKLFEGYYSKCYIYFFAVKTYLDAQNGVQMMKSSIRKPALSPQSILKENLEKQKLCETLRSDESQQNSVQNLQKSTNTRMFTKSLSGPARSSELVKSPSMRSSPKKVSQKDQEKNSDMLLEKQQSSRAQNNIRKAKQNHGKVDLESSSDKNNYNYKIPSDSGKSKEDRNSKIKTVQSGPVTDQQGTRSLKLRSKIVIDSPHKTSQNSNDRKGNLLKHLVIHQEKRPFSCSKCEATFKRKLNLKAHMSTHLEEKEFECPVCKKRYTRKLNLDDHMKAHSGHKPYTCLVCARTFSCGSNLRRHMVSHTGLRPFECEVCGKKYGRKSILTEHMASHSREQPFSCSICKNKFSLKNTLRKHMRIHDKERKYKCSECEATFSQKVHLNQHMFKHTGDKPFKCSVFPQHLKTGQETGQHKQQSNNSTDHKKFTLNSLTCAVLHQCFQ